jgi:hypothetical protein
MTYWPGGFYHNQTLSLLVHAHSKVGKTWLGSTAPSPKLILDAEAGTQWIPGEKIYWDPLFEPPPILGQGRPAPGAEPVYIEWDTCIVRMRDWAAVQSVYQWLMIGNHVFRSVVIDSISEIQKRAKDNLVGIGQMKQQDWGDLLTHMETLIRQYRDLTTHPTKPIQCVCVIAFTRELNGRHVPYVQGQLAVTMPYFLDVIGYLYVQPLEDGTRMRRLLVAPDPAFEAGERVGGRLGDVVDNPDLTVMLHQVYGVPLG